MSSAQTALIHQSKQQASSQQFRGKPEQRRNNSNGSNRGSKSVSKNDNTKKSHDLITHLTGGLQQDSGRKGSSDFVPQKPTEEMKKDRRNKDRLQHLTKLLPQKSKWLGYLDVGCGNAEISCAIAESLDIDTIYGVDVFKEEDFVQPQSERVVNYFQNTNNVLAMETDSVDLITCFMAIHHFEQLDAMLKEISRVLILDGYLFIREHDVPIHDKALRVYIEDMHRQYPDHPADGYMKLFNREELTDILATYGFDYLGDSNYTGTNPQAVYHSLYVLKRKEEKKEVVKQKKNKKKKGEKTVAETTQLEQKIVESLPIIEEKKENCILQAIKLPWVQEPEIVKEQIDQQEKDLEFNNIEEYKEEEKLNENKYFSEIDEDGFQVVGSKEKKRKAMQSEKLNLSSKKGEEIDKNNSSSSNNFNNNSEEKKNTKKQSKQQQQQPLGLTKSSSKR